MSRFTCQICNRRKSLRADGTIPRHYVQGEPCPGEGAPPLQVDDGRLRELAARCRYTTAIWRGALYNLVVVLMGLAVYLAASLFVATTVARLLRPSNAKPSK